MREHFFDIIKQWIRYDFFFGVDSMILKKVAKKPPRNPKLCFGRLEDVPHLK